jgi:hypothetical protein
MSDEAKKEVIEGVEKAFHPEKAEAPAQGPGRETSEEEQQGVPPTDTGATSPLGVGESTTGRAEEIAARHEEPGRQRAGTKGESERPVGTSSAEDDSGVAPKGTIDDDMPDSPAGDQGG